jgi:hypothetical protein
MACCLTNNNRPRRRRLGWIPPPFLQLEEKYLSDIEGKQVQAAILPDAQRLFDAGVIGRDDIGTLVACGAWEMEEKGTSAAISAMPTRKDGRWVEFFGYVEREGEVCEAIVFTADDNVTGINEEFDNELRSFREQLRVHRSGDV